MLRRAFNRAVRSVVAIAAIFTLAACVTTQGPSEALAVNKQYNAYKYVKDDKQKLSTCEELARFGGDCEEFALCKAEALNRANPSFKAHVQLVFVKGTDKQHAITVYQDQGQQYYLDNKKPYGGSLREGQERYDFTGVEIVVRKTAQGRVIEGVEMPNITPSM